MIILLASLARFEPVWQWYLAIPGLTGQKRNTLRAELSWRPGKTKAGYQLLDDDLGNPAFKKADKSYASKYPVCSPELNLCFKKE